jgi:hypothetical protein
MFRLDTYPLVHYQESPLNNIMILMCITLYKLSRTSPCILLVMLALLLTRRVIQGLSNVSCRLTGLRLSQDQIFLLLVDASRFPPF